jgi:hypothetical protein
MPATRSKGNVVHDNLGNVTLKRGSDGEKEWAIAAVSVHSNVPGTGLRVWEGVRRELLSHFRALDVPNTREGSNSSNGIGDAHEHAVRMRNDDINLHLDRP